MNEKGFIASSLLYGMLALFLTIMISTMYILGNNKMAMDKLRSQALGDSSANNTDQSISLDNIYELLETTFFDSSNIDDIMDIIDELNDFRNENDIEIPSGDMNNKKVIIIGDINGVEADRIDKYVTHIGATVVYKVDLDFTSTAAGALDLTAQQKIKEAYDNYSTGLIVILGNNEGEAASLYAETVTLGDPTYAGPLTGVQLYIPVCHIFEEFIINQDLNLYKKYIIDNSD